MDKDLKLALGAATFIVVWLAIVSGIIVAAAHFIIKYW